MRKMNNQKKTKIKENISTLGHIERSHNTQKMVLKYNNKLKQNKTMNITLSQQAYQKM